MRCSYNLTLLSLKDLANICNIGRKYVFPYSILNENYHKNIIPSPELFNSEDEYFEFIHQFGDKPNMDLILSEYCDNDAIITKKSIIEYWKIIYELGFFSNTGILTAAKLSVTSFFKKNIFLRERIPIKIDNLLRPYYFGGRVEVFANMGPNEIALHFDWRGMYSQCMCEPILGGESYISDKVLTISEPGFYWIRFIQDMTYPILPIREGKLLFPNGEFSGWYWFEEILLAVEYGVKILECTKFIGSQFYKPFLRDFATENINIRLRGSIFKQIGKNNNNTFYGRVGMNPKIPNEEIISKPDFQKKFENIREINGIYLTKTSKKHSISNILISASITSKARIKLYRGMMGIMNRGGRVLYVDTDSIIAAFPKTTYKNYLDTPIGEVFFDSSLEDTIIHESVFALPKTYAIRYKDKEIVKIKGFNTRPDFINFKKIFYTDGIYYTNVDEWSKKDFQITIESFEKKTNLHALGKRIWTNSKLDTIPLKL